VLAKPNVIMNDIRLRGLAVASEAGSRKNSHNHAQTARNLKRALRNAAAGARLIEAEGLDSKSAADLVDALADALPELHRLQRSLDRRIRRDQGRSHGVRGI
jgi:outer membrane receptor for ferrienterochelin and colicin